MSITSAYRNLLMEYLPKPIKSEQEYQHALGQLEQLVVPNPSAARSQLIELGMPPFSVPGVMRVRVG